MLSSSSPHRVSPSSSLKHPVHRSSQGPLTLLPGSRRATLELHLRSTPQVSNGSPKEAQPALEVTSTAKDPPQRIYIDCCWSQRSCCDSASDGRFFYTVDLILDVSSKPLAAVQPNWQRPDHSMDEHIVLEHSHTTPSKRCFWSALQSLGTVQGTGNAMLKLILPAAAGYVARTDYLEMRLQDCPRVASVHSFLEPSGRCETLSPEQLENCALLDVIERTAGVITLSPRAATESYQAAFEALNKDLDARLNCSWVLNQQIGSKRIALIRGRPNARIGGPVYRAAAALAIKLVIVDEENHWLQPDTEDNRKFREAFLVTDMTEDSGVVGRIVRSLKQYPLQIHGVFTLSDNFLLAASAVATELGLPTCPISAYETAVDKYRSRQLQDDDGQTVKVGSLTDLEGLMTSKSTHGPAFTPSYPMIVKPIKGWSSECVTKVNNKAELFHAVEKACGRHRGSAVIESYVEGPEIDVNFILCKGEILFVEVVDELPSRGDAKDATVHDSFSETGLMFPSILPPEEQAIAISTLRDLLVGLRFLTGAFHVEARISNSSMEHRNVAGVVHLVAARNKPLSQPRCRLIEINARPGGFRVTLPTKHTYGVDFYAAHMLAAVGDFDRLKSLSRPFGYTIASNGAQYWSRVVYITITHEGIVKREDACEDLKRCCPDLEPFISIAHCYYGKGDKVHPLADGASSFFAHLLIFSRQSRQHVMEIAERVQAEFRIELGS